MDIENTVNKISLAVSSAGVNAVAKPDVKSDVKLQAVEAVSRDSDAEQSQPTEISTEQLQQAVTQMNDHVQNLQRSLQFTVDELSGKDVVTVRDIETEEVIRQIPSEEALALARRLAEQRDDSISLFSELNTLMV